VKDTVARADAMAAWKHNGQFRKDGRTPYVEHPRAVMRIVRDEFEVDDPETLATALLHDTIEDTTTDYDEVAEAFGERVADGVALLTKDKRLPEKRREREYFAGLAQAPSRVKLVKCADSLHNLRDSGAGKRPKAEEKARKLLALFKGDPALRKALALLRAELGRD